MQAFQSACNLFGFEVTLKACRTEAKLKSLTSERARKEMLLLIGTNSSEKEKKQTKKKQHSFSFLNILVLGRLSAESLHVSRF